MSGNKQVRQDSTYVSNVTQADRDWFHAVPDMTRDKFRASVKFLNGVDGKKVQISNDMRLAPHTYGFADSADAARWQFDLQKAIVGQR